MADLRCRIFEHVRLVNSVEGPVVRSWCSSGCRLAHKEPKSGVSLSILSRASRPSESSTTRPNCSQLSVLWNHRMPSLNIHFHSNKRPDSTNSGASEHNNHKVCYTSVRSLCSAGAWQFIPDIYI